MAKAEFSSAAEKTEIGTQHMENGQESSRDFAQSSGESEYCAIGSGAADALYAKAVMTEIGLEVQAVVLSDSSSGRGFAKRQGFSARTRHVKCVCVCVFEADGCVHHV